MPEIVKDVIRLKIPYLWLQEGVCHEEAVKWAEADGILVVMDRCIYKEHARLITPEGSVWHRTSFDNSAGTTTMEWRVKPSPLRSASLARF